MKSLNQQVEKIIISLKIMAKLNENDKLVFRNRNIYIQTPSLFTSIIRNFHGDNRQDTITGIIQLLNDLDVILNEYKKNPDLRSQENYIGLFRLKYSTEASMNGIDNLKSTYAQDPVIKSRLESIIERLRLFTIDFKKLINEYTPGSIDDMTLVDV